MSTRRRSTVRRSLRPGRKGDSPKAPSPKNESARLESLRNFQILDTAPEKGFDDLTLLASQICGTPVAMVSLVAADRQWFKSKVGLQVEQTPRDIAFCAHTILQQDVMVVPDTSLDERFASNPLVTSQPFLRFYAGMPLITPEGHALGTLCVADRAPRTLSPAQIEGLRVLGRQVMHQMRLRRLVFDLENTIEQRKRTEEALAEVNARLKAVLDAATEVSVIATDTSGVIVVFNSGAERMLGYAAEEVVGKQTPEMIHLRSEVEERGRSLSQEFGKPVTGFDVFVEHARRCRPAVNEWTYVRKDGSQLTVNLAVTAVYDHRGELSGFLGVASDITARKRSEEELARAKAAAEAANRAKSEFLANMSHEIRTPLNGVLGMAQLLEDTQLTPEQRECLGVIRTSAESLLTVINDILDFSKIEAGKLDFDLAPFPLHHRLQEITTAFRFRALQKQLTLECKIAPDVPQEVVGDPTRLCQVIINLLSNAIKFTERGQVLLQVASESHTGEDVVLRFSVQDTGIGIPLEKQERVFRAFEQADTSTARRYGGTGLGLTISSTLVHMMQGRLWVESEAGRGSTFHFTARFGAAQEQEGTEAPSAVARSAPPVLTRGLRILLVEDNAVNQMVAVRLLEKQGHTVVVAGDGQRALVAFQRETFDVVLMDVQMPDMDGFEAAATIREREKVSGGHVPIIAMTARAMKGDRERCLDAGMDGYVPKPVQASALRDMIARVTVGAVAASTVAVPWNRELALGRLVGDEHLLAEVAVLFLKNAPRMLTAIRCAVDHRDPLALESAAHALKGSSSTFEAKEVMDAALQLETAGREGQLAGAAECFARLESHLERLQSSLRTFIKGALP